MVYTCVYVHVCRPRGAMYNVCKYANIMLATLHTYTDIQKNANLRCFDE